MCQALKICLLLVLLISPGRLAAEPPNAVCRVNNRLASFNNVGSGTLVDKTDDGREGLVLTCAHLFSAGVGTVVVEFPGGKSHGAKVVAMDREADLAALAICNPAAEHAAVAFEFEKSQRVQACGFGPSGEFACAAGPVVGEASDAGQLNVLIGDAVRSGDSGGGVFDAQGNLVAVVWGEAGGITYASTGPPLRRFLDRVLGRRTAFVYACPGGMCPRPYQGGVNRPRPSAEADSPILEEIQRRLALVEQNKQDRGDYVTRGEFGNLANREEVTRLESQFTDRHESLLAQIDALRPGLAHVAGTAAAGLLGISGPAGWGVLAATTLGGWLAGRLLKRGVGGRRGARFRSGASS